MKKLKSIIGLSALMAFAGCSVKIKGHWDEALPGHFLASTPLLQGESYLLKNNTDQTLYIWLEDDRTPLQYFPLLKGESREFDSPGNAFDLFLYDTSPQAIKGVSLWWIPN